MKYLKIKPDLTIQYPYTIQQLYEEHPNTSFQSILTLEILLEYNIHPVVEVGRGYDITKNYEETAPIMIGDTYYQNWAVTDASEEEIEQRTNNKWSEVRSIRTQYLSESDWTQLNDSPLTRGKKAEWIQYRQDLRDITTQPDPFNIVWPVKPQ